ncbi:sphingosine-1-phosphate phosphatase 2-like [Phlebotomus argentipes]|uniref:sphingosine-1-phosphate phosphatase 2-like n=1 Tax=Phlebotomus argentipes TaxID=94469 RepID=UPI0028932099|nr:sphingosine-1-phosphate phosphatase 2-like [Phlebotomus argentipes]
MIETLSVDFQIPFPIQSTAFPLEDLRAIICGEDVWLEMGAVREFLESLKSPHLVVKVQEFFGIVYKDEPQTPASSNGVTKSPRRRRTAEKSTDKETARSHESKDDDSSAAEEELRCRITNRFWYYLFVVGTELGDEIFYASFIPFWFWNIDGAVGRRMVMVWALVMYVGQGLKDVIRCPRPGHPVQKLQTKWALEYGLPSTHAMVSVAIPFSVLIYTLDRYQYSACAGIAVALVWSSVICLSRIYLGMHSVLDIAAGLFFTGILLFPLIPLVDWADQHILSQRFSPALLTVVSILLIAVYPSADRWTPTRGDTTLCLAVCVGIHVGAWINYQAGDMKVPAAAPPYPVIWPSHGLLGQILLRTVLGLCAIVATRAIAKSVSYAFICAVLGKSRDQIRHSADTLENRTKIFVDLFYKYFTYFWIGFNTQYLLPNFFKLLGIGRPDFYTEI